MGKSRSWRQMIGIVLTFTLLLDLLAACGGGASQAGEGSVQDSPAGGESDGLSGEFTIWTWDLAHENILETFGKKYPNIKINIVDVANADMLKKVQTTIASGGELPELIRVERKALPKYIDMGILENLEQPPYNADRSVFFDYAVSSHENEDGDLIAIPEDMSLAGLAYKKPLAKEYFGTDVPEQLEAMFPTWDALIDKGKEVLLKSGGQVKLFATIEEVFTLVSGQRENGFFDGNKLNEAELRSVYETVIQFRDAGLVDKMDAWTPAWNASFGQDNHIFTPSAIWSPQYVIGPNDKEGGPRWGLMVPPEGGVIWGGSSHGILKDSKNKELAYKFIEFTSMTQEGAETFKKDGMFTHFEAAYKDDNFSLWTWESFGEQNIGQKYFTDIAQTTAEPQRNIYDFSLDETHSIIWQTLARDNAFGIDQVIEKIKSEIKAKDPDIVTE